MGALRELGFELDDAQASELEIGKDFVQLRRGPLDLDLVFTPDGIERFEDAWRRRVEVEGFPVCSLDDIIASKEAAGRVKDRESLPRLRSFPSGCGAAVAESACVGGAFARPFSRASIRNAPGPFFAAAAIDFASLGRPPQASRRGAKRA